MKTQIKQLRVLTILVVGFPLASFSAHCADKVVASTTTVDEPSQYVEFIAQLDGRCQNLSSGGKLQVVKNNHSDKKIKYRFNRMFAGKRQAGLAIGILEPGNNPVKLGCTKVDGRDQTWEIQIVNFVE